MGFGTESFIGFNEGLNETITKRWAKSIIGLHLMSNSKSRIIAK